MTEELDGSQQQQQLLNTKQSTHRQGARKWRVQSARIALARIREERECDRNLGQTIRELEQDLIDNEGLGVTPNR